jgi:hypothetical protein
MIRFRVHLLARSISSILATAEEAYRWLDQHARAGERYVLCAVDGEGVVTPIDQDVWFPSNGQAGRQRGSDLSAKPGA